MGKPEMCPLLLCIFFTAKAPGKTENMSLRVLHPLTVVNSFLLCGKLGLGLQKPLQNSDSCLSLTRVYQQARTEGLCSGRLAGDRGYSGKQTQALHWGAPRLVGKAGT